MFSLLKSYKWWLALLLAVSIVANGLSLLVPKLVSDYIDDYNVRASFRYEHIMLVLGLLAVVILAFTVVQYIVSTYFSEKVAFDIRNSLGDKLKDQSFRFVAEKTPATLLTYMTSDVEQVKSVIGQGMVGVTTALVTEIGVIILLLYINFHLALITLAVIPFLAFTFYFVFGNLSKLFRLNQENIEKINKVINESIVASGLIRVLNSRSDEMVKFDTVNSRARDIGLSLNKFLSAFIPILTFIANLTTIIILWFGGREVIAGQLTLGSMNAFFAYAAMFVWPLFILGFSGTFFSRAAVSWKRIQTVLQSETHVMGGTVKKDLHGKVEFKNVNLTYAERTVLKDISFSIQPNTRTAIIGPTAAGKTRLFYLLSSLITENTGTILVDEIDIKEWDQESYLRQVGLVFQDSVIFNTTLRENIMFRDTFENVDTEALLNKAIDTAELGDLVKSLPQGLDSKVSERGVNLSGGQKQRLMLARALSINPELLLLDDFTARVDIATENKIIENIGKNYPDLTLISITQKIEPIKNYDQVILLMEGELLAKGTHDELMRYSFEYRQIYESQQRTHE
jgi:ATP-binding cassette subfamily B protein